MITTMTLNSSMVVYGDPYSLAVMQQGRGNATPPLLRAVNRSFKSLPPCATHPEVLSSPAKYTHRSHVPSVELGCIWNSKASLMLLSSQKYPNFTWHAWLDVGMHGIPGNSYSAFHNHDGAPWPDKAGLSALPQDKIIVSYSSSAGWKGCEKCREWKYCHCVAGTSFLVPFAGLQMFTRDFLRMFRTCLAVKRDAGQFVCMSDQVIMTHMVLEKPGMFHFIGVGYGLVAEQLTTVTSKARQAHQQYVMAGEE